MNSKTIKKWIMIGGLTACFLLYFIVKFVVPQIVSLRSIKEEKENDVSYVNDVLPADVRGLGATIDKVDYEITQTDKTKNVEGLETVKLNNYLDVEVDQGVISNEYSMVKITLNIKNQKNEGINLTPNSNHLYVYDDTAQCIMLYEPVYMEPYTYPQSSRQHFHLDMNEKQEQNISLYYIVSDEHFAENNEIRFTLNPLGIDVESLAPKDDGSKYVVEYDLKKMLNSEAANIVQTGTSNESETNVQSDSKAQINQVMGLEYNVLKADILETVEGNQKEALDKYIAELSDIKNECSIVRIELTIANISDETISFQNENEILYIQNKNNGKASEMMAIPFYIEEEHQKLESSDIDIQVNEKKNFAYYYVADKQFLDSQNNELKLLVNHSGEEVSPKIKQPQLEGKYCLIDLWQFIEKEE